MQKIATCFVALSVLFAGCASVPRGAEYVPTVDMKGKDEETFKTDLAECQVYASKQMSEAQKAAAGALAGALIGALVAPRGYRNQVAGRTAAIGAAAGAAEGMNTREGVTKRCLMGRGYNVLN